MLKWHVMKGELPCTMRNEKKTYLSQTGDKIALRQFPNIEPFEESMGKDLCEMSKEELQRIADKTLWGSSNDFVRHHAERCVLSKLVYGEWL